MTATTDWEDWDGDGEDDDDDEHPSYVHPNCVDVCGAIDFQACCMYPTTLWTRRIDRMITALARDTVPHIAGMKAGGPPTDAVLRRLRPIADEAEAVQHQGIDTFPEPELFQFSCLFERAKLLIDCILETQEEPNAEIESGAEILLDTIDSIWERLSGGRPPNRFRR